MMPDDLTKSAPGVGTDKLGDEIRTPIAQDISTASSECLKKQEREAFISQKYFAHFMLTWEIHK